MYRHVLMTMMIATALLTSLPQRAEAQNKTTPVREVAPPGTEPYSTLFTISVVSGSGVVASSPDPVPANRRLVIEFVSVQILLQPGEKPLFTLNDSINGTSHPYLLPMAFIESGTHGDIYRSTQLVKLYHDGNGSSGPGAQCGRNQNSFAPMECSIAISGYLIPR